MKNFEEIVKRLKKYNRKIFVCDTNIKLTSAFLDVREFWGITHVAMISSGPVHIGTFRTFPVISTKKTSTFFRGCLPDF